MRKARLILFILMLVNSLSAQQSESYTSPSGNYSINLTQGTTVQWKELSSGSLDIFISKENGGFRYAIAIAEMPTDNTYESLFTPDYRDNFQRGCGCDISGDREVSYDHFKGLLYEMSKEENETPFKGYIISTVQKGNLFNITWMVLPNNFDKYLQEFQVIINSIKIN